MVDGISEQKMPFSKSKQHTIEKKKTKMKMTVESCSKISELQISNDEIKFDVAFQASWSHKFSAMLLRVNNNHNHQNNPVSFKPFARKDNVKEAFDGAVELGNSDGFQKTLTSFVEVATKTFEDRRERRDAENKLERERIDAEVKTEAKKVDAELEKVNKVCGVLSLLIYVIAAVVALHYLDKAGLIGNGQ